MRNLSILLFKIHLLHINSLDGSDFRVKFAPLGGVANQMEEDNAFSGADLRGEFVKPDARIDDMGIL